VSELSGRAEMSAWLEARGLPRRVGEGVLDRREHARRDARGEGLEQLSTPMTIVEPIMGVRYRTAARSSPGR
jgi:transposase InsO family protein